MVMISESDLLQVSGYRDAKRCWRSKLFVAESLLLLFHSSSLTLGFFRLNKTTMLTMYMLQKWSKHSRTPTHHWEKRTKDVTRQEPKKKRMITHGWEGGNENRQDFYRAFIQLGVEAHDDSFHYPLHKLWAHVWSTFSARWVQTKGSILPLFLKWMSILLQLHIFMWHTPVGSQR